jgi:hypothetical protein
MRDSNTPSVDEMEFKTLNLPIFDLETLLPGKIP